jgi:hypothetical protein
MTIQTQIDDLVEQIKESRIAHRDALHEIFIQWMWNDGQIIANHPIWQKYGNKGKLLAILSERTGYSKRYFQYAVKVYNAFPAGSFQEALPLMQKALPNNYRITQKDLINFVSGTKTKSVQVSTNFKNAIPSYADSLKFNPGDVVRIYRADGSIEEYRIVARPQAV